MPAAASLVTQVSEDDAAKMVDSTARRSAALAALLNGKKIKGVSAVDVTWVATDKDGNIKVAVAYDVTKGADRRINSRHHQRIRRTCDRR